MSAAPKCLISNGLENGKMRERRNPLNRLGYSDGESNTYGFPRILTRLRGQFPII